jgi:bifunctional polynucleotide phosphatase/kinase
MWSVLNETLLMYKPILESDQLSSYRTIFGFDFDSTLVTQKSGKKFPIDGDDWKPLYDDDSEGNNVIKDKLQKAFNDEKIIVIFSNQSGVSKKKLTIEEVKKRFNNFLNYMSSTGIPIFIFIALAEDQYRKPSTAMWIETLKTLEEEIHSQTKNEMEQKISIRWDTGNSLYVGDAAGRKKCCFPVPNKRGKDFACSDRKFAYNIGINFQTPEEFFLNEEAPNLELWEWGGFDPSSLYYFKNNVSNQKRIDKQQKQLQRIIEEDANVNGKNAMRNIEISIESDVDESESEIIVQENEVQEIVLLIGPPSSGKSTFCASYFPNYTLVNMDTLKTKAKCLKATREAIAQGKSVIIDNTNPSKKSRAEYISIIKGKMKDQPKIDGSSHNITVRCVVMDVSKDLALHLNMLRVKMTQGKRKKNPTVAYNVYYKNYETPAKEEGIDEIITLPFKIKFKDELHRHLFFERT